MVFSFFGNEDSALWLVQDFEKASKDPYLYQQLRTLPCVSEGSWEVRSLAEPRPVPRLTSTN
jgi:hypothetical protein